MKINFRQLWSCCWGNETHVATFFKDDGVTPSYHAVCASCASQFTGETREITAAELATFEAEPRKAGDVCYNGYWNSFYLVLDVTATSITVLNLTTPNERLGKFINTLNVKTHMTAWDWRRDKFVEHGLLDNMIAGKIYQWDSVDDLTATLTDICLTWAETEEVSA